MINEMDYAKSLKSKLADTQRDLQFAQMQKTEMQKTLEKTKATNEFASNELQQQLKTLQREKEEIAKRESTRVKVTRARIRNVDYYKYLHSRSMIYVLINPEPPSESFLAERGDFVRERASQARRRGVDLAKRL